MGTAAVPWVVLCTTLALCCASASPLDMILYQKQIEPSKPIFSPPSQRYEELGTTEDKPKNCFHFFVSRNMSSLLSEATKMLRTIRSPKEREWLLTFIYRIKSLAEHLRAHPESRNYYCLPSDDESKKRTLSEVKEQPELYFEDEVAKRVEEDILPDGKDNQASSKPSEQQPAAAAASHKEVVLDASSAAPPRPSGSATEAVPINLTEDPSKMVPTKTEEVISQSQEVTQAIDKKSDSKVPSQEAANNAIVVSAMSDCVKTKECIENSNSPPKEASETFFADAGEADPMYLAENFSPEDIERYEQERLKIRIRKALLEELAPEIRKLKTVGGTPKDLMYLWNGYVSPYDKEDAEADFDYEDNGAAIGDLSINEKTLPDRTVAPSLDEVQNTKEIPNLAKDASYEPYDESDVLVQQLFDARFGDQPPKTTKSLGDQSNNEYLITSTNTPF